MPNIPAIASCAALLTAGALLNSSCGRESSPRAVHAGNAEQRQSVAVSRVVLRNLERTMVLTAEFRPYQEVDVMAKVAGYVKQIRVDIGDRVRQGEPLATLEVPEMTDDLAKAAASLQRNEAEVRRARQELIRARSAHDIAHLTYQRLAEVMKNRPGLIAQQEIDDSHSRDLVAEAQVAAAQGVVAAAEEQVKVSKAEQSRTRTLFNYTTVSAPFAGVITKRYADTGSMIQAGTASQTQAMPLVRLSQNTLLRLILPVPESEVSRIRIGSSVDVRVPSLKHSFPGKVVRFADKVQLATRTMDTEVDVPNPDYVLIPGMYAEVDLVLDHSSNVLSVPVTAITHSEEGSTVMLVRPDGKIEERTVETGLETARNVEIKAGLEAGDLVVVGSRTQLQAGEVVTPRVVEFAALEKRR
ncbi:MAG TPA: efflux RND transporter periplasmic adaptor subunit [Bryobacteraceae bacterium]|jgi:RND family efflux transporter MFP subunit|nr:efflux RND transporter periplasmic adaptor subunit [Bryobacteraceae bacterium]